LDSLVTNVIDWYISTICTFLNVSCERSLYEYKEVDSYTQSYCNHYLYSFLDSYYYNRWGLPMTPQQQEIIDACIELNNKLKETVPDHVAHWAIEQLRDAISSLAYVVHTVKTKDY